MDSAKVKNKDLPRGLSVWFVIHFIADISFALPLFVAPKFSLELLGWQSVDPVATRLVAAALFAIGIQSFIGRHENRDAFRAMLNLKIIWSMTAILGLGLCLVQGAPVFTWGVFIIFLLFSALWWYYRFQIDRTIDKGEHA